MRPAARRGDDRGEGQVQAEKNGTWIPLRSLDDDTGPGAGT